MTTVDQVMLVVEGGPNSNQEIPLLGPTTTLGRQPGNDVVVAETGVSRQHAEIASTDDGYRLRDLSSTNGTFVNSKKVEGEGSLLKDGDKIRLGPSGVLLVFRSPTAHTQALTLEKPADGGTEAWVVKEPEEPSMTMATDLSEVAAAAPAGGEPTYEGNVQLTVGADVSMGLVVNFLQQLRERPEFRILRMANNREGGTDVWLALRQPVPILRVLGEMDGVTQVSPAKEADSSSEDGVTVTVLLGAKGSNPSEAGALCVNCKEPLEPGTAICPNCRKTQA